MSEGQNNGVINGAIEASKQGIGNIQNSVSNLASNVAETTQGAVSNVREGVSNTMGNFSNVNAVQASQEFLESNTIIAKAGFIILVLILLACRPRRREKKKKQWRHTKLLRIGVVFQFPFTQFLKQQVLIIIQIMNLRPSLKVILLLQI